MSSSDKRFFDAFIGRYPVNKTLQFALIPQGRTQEYINQYGFVANDEQRNQDYKELKRLIDNYHRTFIERSLSSIRDIIKWEDLIYALDHYQKAEGKEKQRCLRQLVAIQAEYRKKIVKAFKAQDDFKTLFSKDLVTRILPETFQEKETQELLSRFNRFTSYLTQFHENRKNAYSDEAKATAISNRIVNENFPFFIANCKNWELLTRRYSGFALQVQENLEQLDSDIDVAQFFEPENYSLVLTQKGIDTYNMILGGGITPDKRKIPGINNIANEKWQQERVEAKRGGERIAPHRIVLQQLYRQILSSHTSTWGSLFDQYANDADVYNALNSLIDNLLEPQEDESSSLIQASELFQRLTENDPSAIQLNPKCEFMFSKICLGEGLYLKEAIETCIDKNLAPVQGMNKAAKAAWKKKPYRSLYEIAQIVDAVEKNQADAEDACSQTNKVVEEERDVRRSAVNSLTPSEVWDVLNISLLIKYLHDLQKEIPDNGKALKEDISILDGDTRKLLQDKKLIQEVKSFLDALLDYQHALRVFEVGPNEKRNPEFYAYYDVLLEKWSFVPAVYDRVRNYATQKPYSKEKYKLSFENPSFLNGWDVDKQNANYGALFLREGKYYLALINPESKIKFEILQDVAEDDVCRDVYQKVDYKLFPDATKMIPKCSIARKEVVAHFKESDTDFILDNKKFTKPLRIPSAIFKLNYDFVDGELVKIETKKYQVAYKRNTGDELGFTQALADWIDFCLDFLESYASTSIYDFSACRNRAYERLDQFYDDVNKLTYSLTMRDVSAKQMHELVEAGQLFLFQIYNKDFAPGASGAKNLHTSYFETIFSDFNLRTNTFKIDGEAEMFYRPASIDNPFVHKTGEMLVNRTFTKMVNGEKVKESLPDEVHHELFEFANGKRSESELSEEAKHYLEESSVVIKRARHEITKDRRFSSPQYSLHIPITINFGVKPIRNLDNNSDVLKCLKHNSDISIIGIDRGERNLLYYSVIDQSGTIVEQGSLNVINGVDYQEKLDLREKERQAQRQSWKSIDKIKDLKKGYLSAAIHEIVELMLKYNAVVVMEDLSGGFKRSRIRFEKQVYQNFEKQLIDKLNYCAAKPTRLDVVDPGGLMKGYQLANKFESFKKLGKQSGCILYVPAWKTSHIDPTTGFMNLFRAAEVKYQNVPAAKDFFARFDRIRYNSSEDTFEFTFSYDNFSTIATSAIDEWTVCARDIELPYVKYEAKSGAEKGNELLWINVNRHLKRLFGEQGISYERGENLIPAIVSVDNRSFFSSLIFLFRFLIALRYSVKLDSGQVIDRIVSPVKNGKGEFFDTDHTSTDLPQDADANGAYNIALKGLQLITEQIDESSDGPWRVSYPKKPNDEWVRFIQDRSWKNQ